MNILPKKRWHVRTKENMARVRRDMKKAEDDEKAILERELLATNEARLNLLRKKGEDRSDKMFGFERNRIDYSEEGGSGGHVNLFEQLEMEEKKNIGETNKEYEEDKKKETREWEAKMGIQMKLGDDGTNGNGYWFEKIPLRRNIKEMKRIEEEKIKKEKLEEEKKNFKIKKKKKKKEEYDEVNDVMKDKKKKKKKRSRSSDSSISYEERIKKKKKKKEKEKEKEKKKKKRMKENEDIDDDDEEKRENEEKKKLLEKMRDERLKRERIEQSKTQFILHPELIKKKEEEEKKKEGKYNSMFNPHISR